MQTNSTNFFEAAGRLFFKREQVKSLETQINAAGISLPVNSFAGYMALNIVVLTIFIFLAAIYSQPFTKFVGQMTIVPGPVMIFGALVGSLIASYIIVTMLVTSYIMMKADDRRRKLET